MSSDVVLTLYAMMSDANNDQATIGKAKITGADAAKKEQMRLYAQALDRAQKAEQEKHGFFDSIGIAGLVGMAMSQPWVVFADIVMHMAHLTPAFVRDFETDHKKEIETASNLWFAWSNGEHLLARDPQAYAAALALGGLLLKETGALGENSDWAGVGLMAFGANTTGTRTELATAIAADKESAVADGIRKVEKESQDYIKWAAIVGMLVAAGAATVVSGGAAAPVVVLVGVALSAGGFAISQTKCLDPMLGENASQWVGLGLGVGGGVISGIGMGGVACEAADALFAGSEMLEGAGQVQSGMYEVQDGAIAKDSADAHAEAQLAQNQIARLQRFIEAYVDELGDLNEAHKRVAGILNETGETQNRTTMIAMGARA